VLNPIAYESRKTPNPTTSSLTTRYAQMYVVLEKCQTQLPWFQNKLNSSAYGSSKEPNSSPWVWSLSKLNMYRVDNLSGSMLGNVDLFIYFHIFEHKILKVKNDHLLISLGV